MKDFISSLISNIKEYSNKYLLDLKEIKGWNLKDFILKRKCSLISVTLVLFLILGYSYGTLITSKGRALKNFEVALKNGKERIARKVIRINDKEVEKERLIPYLEYYKGNSSKVDNLIKELQDDGKTAHAEVKSTDKLLGRDYYINLNVYNLKIESNFEDAIIYINETELISKGETLRGLVPGVYTIKGVLKTEFGDIIESTEYVVDKDDVTEINFKASNINLSSNFSDAEVFINNEKTKFKVDDIKDFGPIPQDGRVSLRLEKELPWGRAKSNEVVIEDIENIKLNVNIKTDSLEKEIAQVVEGFYSSVFEALNNENKELIINATDVTKDKIYDELTKKQFFFKNQYKLINSTVDEEKSVFEYKDGVYRGTIVTDIDYEVSKVFFGVGKEVKNKKNFTNVVYKKGEWMVENVENFSF